MKKRKRRTKKGVNWQPFGKGEKQALCEWASAFAKHASSPNDPLREVSRRLLNEVLWFWTADAIDPLDGCVVRDAIKYDFEHLRFTQAAWEQLEQNKGEHKKRATGWKVGLQHEHIVPRACLIDKILESDHDPATIHGLLERLCRAAIVTAKEHHDLPDLPQDWDEKDVEVRYKENPLRGPLSKSEIEGLGGGRTPPVGTQPSVLSSSKLR